MENENHFAIANVLPGKLNALVKNLMKQTGVNDPNEAVRLINSGEWIVTRSEAFSQWAETHFVVTTDGTTGEQWVSRLDRKGTKVSATTTSVLYSKQFKPGEPKVRGIAVMRGNPFVNGGLTSRYIREVAKNRGLLVPGAEIACLIREKFTREDLKAMGLTHIVTMHDPIKSSEGYSSLLAVGSTGDTRLSLGDGDPYCEWTMGTGFAFEVKDDL